MSEGSVMTRGLCAYAITREHTPHPDVRLVTHDGLALVVAEVDLAPFVELEAHRARWHRNPSPDDPLVALARRHDEVVRAVFAHSPVLPLRLATVVDDEPAAVGLLTEHHDQALAWLDRVAGHREWGVRARLPRPDESAEVPAEDLSDTEYLAVRRNRLAAAARMRRDASAAAAALHEALSPHATETVLRTRRSGIPLLDAAYLVRAEAEPDFRAEAAAHPELAVDVLGPRPPYSFVNLEPDTGAVAHA
ncbi:GvpL/GvpF family gas vesicle protein [Actinophytocola sp.]|uniref:GvpL/GvpF family gas vesicle protein n=1 Tax=Actinophytocola sp. TaxID=1872138 RepID=UPI00389B187F